MKGGLAEELGQYERWQQEFRGYLNTSPGRRAVFDLGDGAECPLMIDTQQRFRAEATFELYSPNRPLPNAAADNIILRRPNPDRNIEHTHFGEQ